MIELLCLTSVTIVYRYWSETLSFPTYGKCHYSVVKELSLVDDEGKKFNQRKDKALLCP